MSAKDNHVTSSRRILFESRSSVHKNEAPSQMQAQQALGKSEERFSLAAQAGRMYAFEWDVANDIVVRSRECTDLLGAGEPTHGRRSELMAKVHPDDRSQCDAIGMTPENPTARVRYRIMRSDGSFLWVEKTARAFFDGEGKMLRVIGMIADITDRIQAEAKIRASEERYRRIVETTREGIWLIDSDFRTSFVNRQMAGMLGYEPEEILGRSVFDFYFPEDIERKRQGLARRREGLVEHFDERLRRRDGSDLWVRMAANPVYTDKGDFDGALAIVCDITDQRLAEAALRDLGGRLIAAHEDERARIARELHDDLSQRMALLSIRLEQSIQQMPELPSPGRQSLRDVSELARAVSADIHSLSHQLHSSKLDTLGLVGAIEALCKEFSQQHHLRINFIHVGIQRQIPKDVTLCLFRITQEALRNVAKHSGAMKADVELSGQRDCIDLCVSDPGIGISAESAKGDCGLGLVSMRERLRLVGGQLTIKSKPFHRGTRVLVRVPLSRADDTLQKAKIHSSGA
jgi:PAS domain S-box-containing protein